MYIQREARRSTQVDRPKVSEALKPAVMEAVMAFGNKIDFIVLGILAQLWFFGTVGADELRPRDNATEQEIVTAPEHYEMTLISSQPWVVEGKILGRLAAYVYKDVSTERPVDYWELYDRQENLLAVSWFDKFGIQRTAVDRGIVEDEDKLEGIFVVVLDGHLI
jgi:hypothetical protein